MKTVIYHSADFDGIFCREIAKKFLGTDGEYIGWNFGDPPLSLPDGELFVLDLPLDKPFGFLNANDWPHLISTVEKKVRVVWIDHHKTSIDSHPTDIPGYRIDGVAACRLAWQYFHSEPFFDKTEDNRLPTKEEFVARQVPEPLAVRLAGEYDVWDKRDPNADLFQYGLRSYEPNFGRLLSDDIAISQSEALQVCQTGYGSRRYAQTVDAGNMKASFLREWEGLKFLCLNGRGNSLTFASRDVPETGHDALLMFYFQGKQFIVSLYHAVHRTDIDLSVIAKKYGGGGHKGACGFQCDKLPFL